MSDLVVKETLQIFKTHRFDWAVEKSNWKDGVNKHNL